MIGSDIQSIYSTNYLKAIRIFRNKLNLQSISDCSPTKQHTSIFSKDEELVVVDALKQFEHFEGLIQFSEEDKLYDLTRLIRLKKLDQGQTVFHFGDKGDNFYFVIEGSVCLYLPKSNEDLNKEQKLQGDIFNMTQRLEEDVFTQFQKLQLQRNLERQTEELKNLIDVEKELLLKICPKNAHKYFFFETFCNFKYLKSLEYQEVFGEISLVSNTQNTRSCTIIAAEDSTLLGMLPQNQYMKIFSHIHEQFSFITKILESSFDQCNPSLSLQLAYNFNGINYTLHETIFKEGDPADMMYIINKGEVALTVDPQNKKLQNQQKIQTGSVLAILGENQIFGHEDLFCNKERTFNAICNSQDTLIFKIMKSVFNNHIFDTLVRDIRRIGKSKLLMYQQRREDLENLLKERLKFIRLSQDNLEKQSTSENQKQQLVSKKSLQKQINATLQSNNQAQIAQGQVLINNNNNDNNINNNAQNNEDVQEEIENKAQEQEQEEKLYQFEVRDFRSPRQQMFFKKGLQNFRSENVMDEDDSDKPINVQMYSQYLKNLEGASQNPVQTQNKNNSKQKVFEFQNVSIKREIDGVRQKAIPMEYVVDLELLKKENMNNPPVLNTFMMGFDDQRKQIMYLKQSKQESKKTSTFHQKNMDQLTIPIEPNSILNREFQNQQFKIKSNSLSFLKKNIEVFTQKEKEQEQKELMVSINNVQKSDTMRSSRNLLVAPDASPRQQQTSIFSQDVAEARIQEEKYQRLNEQIFTHFKSQRLLDMAQQNLVTTTKDVDKYNTERFQVTSYSLIKGEDSILANKLSNFPSNRSIYSKFNSAKEDRLDSDQDLSIDQHPNMNETKRKDQKLTPYIRFHMEPGMTIYDHDKVIESSQGFGFNVSENSSPRYMNQSNFNSLVTNINSSNHLDINSQNIEKLLYQGQLERQILPKVGSITKGQSFGGTEGGKLLKKYVEEVSDLNLIQNHQKSLKIKNDISISLNKGSSTLKFHQLFEINQKKHSFHSSVTTTNINSPMNIESSRNIGFNLSSHPDEIQYQTVFNTPIHSQATSPLSITKTQSGFQNHQI